MVNLEVDATHTKHRYQLLCWVRQVYPRTKSWNFFDQLDQHDSKAQFFSGSRIQNLINLMGKLFRCLENILYHQHFYKLVSFLMSPSFCLFVFIGAVILKFFLPNKSGKWTFKTFRNHISTEKVVTNYLLRFTTMYGATQIDARKKVD